MPKKKNLSKAEKDELYKKNIPILKRILKRTRSAIGIDLGTNETGFYHHHFYDALLGFGMRISPGKLQINQRICKIVDSIDELLVNKKNTIVIIEDYSFGLRGSSVSQLSELGGSVKTTLLKSGFNYFTLAPQTLKKFVLGPQRGSKVGKEFMLMQVLDKWGVKFDSADVCDAFCLAMFVYELKLFIINEGSGLKWQDEMFRDFIINRGIPVMP
jgi:Holliday junction resolvasome RuvABC endonuclease subunit